MNTSQELRTSPLNVPAQDLQRCHDLLGPEAWQSIAGQRIFITGGTGFVGKWLLATLLDAEEVFGLGCRITVLSRDPAAFLRLWPNLAGQVSWIAGDVRNFEIGTGRHDIVIHAATDVAVQASPQQTFSTCLEGTRRVLELARIGGARRLLLLSSGAVYGPLPEGMTHVPETYLGGPDQLKASSAYGEGKRVSEWMASQADIAGLDVHIARLFAVVGPHLPLDRHFAVGNFLGAAMRGEDIAVSGDGTPYRSYLYAADMAAWLWAVLLRGKPNHAYNVGSENSLSILELARRVANLLCPSVGVRVGTATSSSMPQHYVPQTRRAISELGLAEPLNLDEALRRTARWHSKAPNSRQTGL